MATIEFTKDFAGKKKGDTWNDCPDRLATRLVHHRKVAKAVSKKTTKTEKA